VQKLQCATYAVSDLRSTALYENLCGENRTIGQKDTRFIAKKRHAMQVQSWASVQVAARIPVKLHAANGR